MQNQTQVATALQVFYNLGSLVSTVNEVVNKVRDNLKNGVKETLDPNTLSQAQPNAGIGNISWGIGNPRVMMDMECYGVKEALDPNKLSQF